MPAKRKHCEDSCTRADWKGTIQQAQAAFGRDSISVDGKQYFSDTFYLLETEDAPSTLSTSTCYCGANGHPPLLSRKALINSLELSGAILGTYTLDLGMMLAEFPQLVGPRSTVPTLVIHDCKGLHNGMDDLGSSFGTVGVKTTWKRDFANVSHEGIREDSSEYRRGVHHPKFLLLFETSGDLVVVVTTCNLTPVKTIEGAWVQRFKRRPVEKTVARKRARKVTQPCHDFGVVLEDFLEKLQCAAVGGESSEKLCVDGFLRRNLGFALRELPTMFVFEVAHAYLVTTVPGEFPRESCATGKSYGRQRIAHILKSTKNSVQSNRDRIVLQPTSFGAKWTRQEVADVVRSYLSDCTTTDDADIVKRLDVVWPSENFMKIVHGGNEAQSDVWKTNHERRIHSDDDAVKDCEGDIVLPVHNKYEYAGTTFFSAEAFNSCEEACIRRLTQYVPSNPRQSPVLTVPHIKSVSRVVRKPCVHENLAQRYGEADHFLGWFLLTSQCFSHGAQGKPLRRGAFQFSHVAYANFELGVLFTSKSTNGTNTANDRIYCFHPRHCTCCHSKPSKLVHLPIPFALHGPRYEARKNGPEMTETPFFHEVSMGLACTGNMRLTPLGRNLARKATS